MEYRIVEKKNWFYVQRKKNIFKDIFVWQFVNLFGMFGEKFFFGMGERFDKKEKAEKALKYLKRIDGDVEREMSKGVKYKI